MLTRIILALALGALTAAVLAWGIPALAVLAGWTPPARAYGPSGAGPSRNLWWADDADAHPRGGVYTIDRASLFDSLDMRRIIFVGDLASQSFYRQNPPPSWAALISIDMREGYEEVLTVRQGWPLRCVRGEMWFDWTPSQQRPTPLLIVQPGGGTALTPATPPPPHKLVNARLARRSGGEEVLVPLEVAWGPAAANVGIHALAWFALLALPGSIRRFVRRLRAQCPRCGYDLRGLSAGSCPECGGKLRTTEAAKPPPTPRAPAAPLATDPQPRADPAANARDNRS